MPCSEGQLTLRSNELPYGVVAVTIVGIISDTHGLLRDEAIEALKKSDLILHAGDVGMREILEQLEQIAPVAAVRGNVDIEPWALKLPLTGLSISLGR